MRVTKLRCTTPNTRATERWKALSLGDIKINVMHRGEGK